LKRIEKDFRN